MSIKPSAPEAAAVPPGHGIRRRKHSSSAAKGFSWATFARLTGVVAVILPFAVQYVSWVNTSWQSDAQNIVSRADTAFKQVETAMDERRYASLVIPDAIQDLTRLNGATGEVSQALIKDVRNSIDAYYTQLTAWNYAYNANLIALDYDLDHPIYKQAGEEAAIAKLVSTSEFPNVVCSNPLSVEVKKGYDENSLKAQFIVIGLCYTKLNKLLKNLMSSTQNEAKSDTDTAANTSGSTTAQPSAVDPDSDITQLLPNVADMINVFECNARRRIGFYISEVRFNIVSPLTPFRWIFLEGAKQRAIDHFAQAKKVCAE